MTGRRKTRERIQNVGRNPYMTMIIVCMASFCDFVTIKSVMEYYLTENVFIQIVITGAIAFILNFLPALLGKTMQEKSTPNRTLMITVQLGAFLLLFTLTFLLRWFSRDMMFENTAALNLMGGVSNEQSAGAGENVLTIIMGCSTLFTSILSFIFAYTAIKPEERKRQIIELRLIELNEQKDISQTHMDELERIIVEDANAHREEGAYQEALKKVDDYGDFFKEKIRMALAEYLQSADAVSIVMQQELPVMV